MYPWSIAPVDTVRVFNYPVFGAVCGSAIPDGQHGVEVVAARTGEDSTSVGVEGCSVQLHLDGNWLTS